MQTRNNQGEVIGEANTSFTVHSRMPKDQYHCAAQPELPKRNWNCRGSKDECERTPERRPKPSSAHGLR